MRKNFCFYFYQKTNVSLFLCLVQSFFVVLEQLIVGMGRMIILKRLQLSVLSFVLFSTQNQVPQIIIGICRFIYIIKTLLVVIRTT